MPQYVVRLIGRLSPPLTIDYADLTKKLPSFSVTVEKETMKAEPHTDIQLEANEARKRFQDEISPPLTVFGFVEGRAISLTVTDIIYPNFGQATRSISARFVLREPPPTKDEVLLKIAWATADPIYRDLLDFFTEAQAAPNPRCGIMIFTLASEIRVYLDFLPFLRSFYVVDISTGTLASTFCIGRSE